MLKNGERDLRRKQDKETSELAEQHARELYDYDEQYYVASRQSTGYIVCGL